MLVLSRGIQGRVLVGEDITITVVEITTHQVKLGFEAPRHVTILREEVWLRNKINNNNDPKSGNK